jgi:SOS response regulatory protein OraA/RecX
MLVKKGVQRGIIDDLLSQNYPAEVQVENVVALLKKRIASRGANREKLYRFVASRGYSGYVIMRAFEQISTETRKSQKK